MLINVQLPPGATQERTRAVMEESREALTGTRDEFTAAKSLVENLALKLKQEEAIAEVKDAAAAARGRVSDELQGDLAHTIALLEKRAAALARKNATRSGDAPATRIPAATDSATLLQQVDAALGEKKTAGL